MKENGKAVLIMLLLIYWAVDAGLLDRAVVTSSVLPDMYSGGEYVTVTKILFPSPEVSVTYEEMTQTITRYLDFKGITEQAKVLEACGLSVITPDREVLRAEAASIIMRLNEAVKALGQAAPAMV